MNDRQDCRAQLQIIQPTIAVGKECTDFAIEHANHATFRLLLQPCVDVAVEQVGSLVLHFRVVAVGNVEAGGYLLMCQLSDSEAVSFPVECQVERRAIRRRFHFQRASIGEEVLPIVSLPLKLSTELRQCFALSQGYLLQSENDANNAPNDFVRGVINDYVVTCTIYI